MVRKSEDKRFYRKEYKDEFISQLVQNSINRAVALLGKSYEYEKRLNKDLYEFSLTEIEEIFRHSESENASNDYYAIKDYLDYNIKKGVISQDTLKKTNLKYFNNLLDENRLRITKEKLDKYISMCFNVQDQLLLMLLFEGVDGVANSEIRNLKKDDIDWDTNTLHLRCDKNGPRDIEVSEECMKLIDKVIKEETFYFNNGEISEKQRRLYENFPENNFIIRNIRKKKTRVDKIFIVSRFNNFKTWFNQPKLNPTVIYQSGLIYYMVQYSKKTGKDIKEFQHRIEYSEIARKFLMKGKEVNGVLQYNAVYRYIKEDEIKALYGNYLNKAFVLQPDENMKKDIIEIKKRKSATQFRKMISNIYEGKCAITDENTYEVLDACHIQDYKNDESNHSQNGILLRTDLHALFDKGLLMIDDNFMVTISDKVKSEYYRQFNGLRIKLPKKIENYPSIEALHDHNKRFIKTIGKSCEFLLN